MSIRRLLPALLLAAATLLCGAAPATALELKPGFYDCMAYDYSSEMLLYKGSVKIKAKSGYEHSFGRKGKTMPKKTTGTFKRSGRLLSFKRGALGGSKAEIERNSDGRAFFNLLYKGEPSGISCYLVTRF